MREAEKSWQLERYADADVQYTLLKGMHPDDVALRFRVAECKRRQGLYAEAERAYQEVLTLDSLPEAHFYLGLMYKINGRLELAWQTFNEVWHRQDLPQTLAWRLEREMAGCRLVMWQDLVPQPHFDFRRLPAPLSGPRHQYAPAVKADTLVAPWVDLAHSTLADTSRRGLSRFTLLTPAAFLGIKRQHVPASHGNWREGGGVFHPTRPEYYFTRCEANAPACRIYVTTWKKGRWSRPRPLPGVINRTGYRTRHPAFSPGGDTLFFASDRPGGRGGDDLWFSLHKGAHGWAAPQNMGDFINTPLDELAPFIDPSDGRLIFASEGHAGMGGFDLFSAHKWFRKQPRVINLGAPFNSSADDVFYTVQADRGWLSSNRAGTFDVYTFYSHSDTAVMSTLATLTSGFHFEKLSVEEKRHLSRLQTRLQVGRALHNDVPLRSDEWNVLQKLATVEKSSLRKYLSEGLEPQALATQADESLRLEALPLEEQERIERIAHAYRRALDEGAPLALSQEDEQYYRQLPEEDWLRLERIIVQRTAELAVHEMPEDGELDYAKLPMEERALADVLPGARRIVSRKIPLEPDSSGGFTYAQLPLRSAEYLVDMATGQTRHLAETEMRSETFSYEFLPELHQLRLTRHRADRTARRIHVTGRLMDAGTGEAAAGVTIALADERGEVVGMTLTGPQGEFQYESPEENQPQKLLVNVPERRPAEGKPYYLDHLTVHEVTGTLLAGEASERVATFETIFFDYNSADLRQEALGVLDELAAFCRRYPEARIDLHAHTDDVGSKEFNRRLSWQRGETVRDYLITEGVAPEALVIWAHGRPQSLAGETNEISRQSNRRVEFEVRNSPVMFESQTFTGILLKETSVETLAQHYGMDPEEFRRLNGITGENLERGQPVRLRKLNETLSNEYVLPR